MHEAKKLTKMNKHELAISLKPTVTMSITLLLCCASLKALNYRRVSIMLSIFTDNEGLRSEIFLYLFCYFFLIKGK